MIKIIQGDKVTKKCTVLKQSDGTPLDLTNYNITLSVKRSIYDTTYAIQKTVGNGGIVKDSPASTGVFYIYFVNIDTQNLEEGKYVYDIEIEDTGTGEPYTIQAPSDFIIELGVTT